MEEGGKTEFVLVCGDLGDNEFGDFVDWEEVEEKVDL